MDQRARPQQPAEEDEDATLRMPDPFAGSVEIGEGELPAGVAEGRVESRAGDATAALGEHAREAEAGAAAGDAAENGGRADVSAAPTARSEDSGRAEVLAALATDPDAGRAAAEPGSGEADPSGAPKETERGDAEGGLGRAAASPFAADRGSVASVAPARAVLAKNAGGAGRGGSVPPPGPGRAIPPQLPSMLLSPQVSTRGEPTERIATIPKTHPLASSIAPGGSTMSSPPTGRRALGWPIGLGALALSAIVAGTSLFLQSRGEHHAAAAVREQERAGALAEPRSAPPNPPALASALPSAEGAPAAQGPRAELVPGPSAPAPEARAPAAEAQPARSHHSSERTRARGASAGAAQRAARPRVDRFRFEHPREPAGPDRSEVIATMNALSQRLRACVGDEHGVADIKLTVRAPGVVSHALVEGKFAGSEQGSCIARTLRSARMPSFEQGIVRIAYPLQL